MLTDNSLLSVNAMINNHLQYRTLTCLVLLLIAIKSTQAQTPYTLTAKDVKLNREGFIRSCSYDFSKNTSGTILTIPVVINKVVVRGIANKKKGVFQDKNIHEIHMFWNIQYIGANAFRNNPITKLDLSNLSFLRFIGGYAFYCDKGLKNCFLPRIFERGNRQFFISWSDLDGYALYPREEWDYSKAYRAQEVPLN